MTSTLVSTFPPEPFSFRNYNFSTETQIQSKYKGTCRKRLCDAIRASTAAPGYFDEYVDGESRFQDGGLIANNPTGMAIHEARKLWPNNKVLCVVSVGTGKEPAKAAKTGLQGTLLTLIESATSTEKVADILEDVMEEGTFYRLNPQGPAFECNLDETRPEMLNKMQVMISVNCGRSC